MQTNDHQIRDYDQVLDNRYGVEGSSEREMAVKEAMAAYGLAESKKMHSISIPESLYAILNQKAVEQGISTRSFASRLLASALL